MKYACARHRLVTGRVTIALLLALSAASCAPTAEKSTRSDGWIQSRPLGAAMPVYRPSEAEPNAAVAPQQTAEPTGSLTIRDAIAHALLKNPELVAFSWEVRATDARILQAGLLPNPELGAEVENFGGSDAQRNFEGAESTFALSQLIEFGGKREKRTRVASLERDLAGWDYEAKRLDVYVETAKSFMDTLAAQLRQGLKQDQLKLVEQIRSTVRERVRAGRASSLEDTKASVQLANASIEVNRARRDLQAKREKLASFWGSTSPEFVRVDGEFDKFQALPPLEELVRRIQDNPDVARLETEGNLSRSALELEQARDVPDLTVSAGVRRSEETGDNAFVAGVSIPIPFFGLNTGGVLEAKRRVSKAGHQKRAAIVRITTDLKQTYREGAALHASLSAISAEVLPGARQAFEAAQQGYREGEFDFLEVLDAERTLFEAHERYIDTAAAYHQTVLDIERLIGQPIASASPGSSSTQTEQK